MKSRMLSSNFYSFGLNFFSNKAYEKRVGFIPLKTREVFFDVQNVKPWAGSNRTCTFLEEKQNIGNAFNMFKGIFTAPVNGIYFFSFITTKSNRVMECRLLFRVNQAEVTQIVRYKDIMNHSIILQSNLKLKAGDQVDVLIETGSLYLEYTHFMGWLQQEENLFL